jgi:integrase
MPARRIKGVWFVDFRFQGERIRKKSPIDTKRGAEEFERQLRKERGDVASGEKEAAPSTPAPEPKVVPTLKEFQEEFVSTYAVSNNKPSEVEAKRCVFRAHLVPEIGHRRLDEIDARVIEHYKAKKLAAGLHPKTINNHLTILGKMLSVAGEWGIITHAPRMKWLKAPDPEFDFLTFEEAERLIAALDDRDAEWRTMIIVAMKTGTRLGEFLAVRWEDIDLVAGRLMVRRSVARNIVGTPKSGKSREVPLAASVLTALKAHRHLRGELVFCS